MICTFSGSNAPALESICDAPRHSFFQNEKVYITHLGLLYPNFKWLLRDKFELGSGFH